MIMSISNNMSRVLIILSVALLLETSVAYQCGEQGGHALCKLGECCSIIGWCGTSGTYCHARFCQSQCPAFSSSALPVPPHPRVSSNISTIITPSIFEEMLPNRDHPSCPARGFYTYDSFLAATSQFPSFGATGTTDTRKREIAAFFAQTSFATKGGKGCARRGKYSWGYCLNKKRLLQQSDYCVHSKEWPCVAGKQYYGRGPFQLTYNHNYGQAGKALGIDLLSNPDLVATNAIVSFETALWFWMTPQDRKPSCHDVIVGRRQGRIFSSKIHPAGFGSTTNVINGFKECGRGSRDDRVTDRIGFFERYCRLLEVSTGDNLDCNKSVPFYKVGLLNPISFN